MVVSANGQNMMNVQSSVEEVIKRELEHVQTLPQNTAEKIASVLKVKQEHVIHKNAKVRFFSRVALILH